MTTKYVQAKTVTFMWVVLSDGPSGTERYGVNVEAGVSKSGKPLLRVVSCVSNPNLNRMILKDDQFTMKAGMFNSVWSLLRNADERRSQRLRPVRNS